MIFDNAIFEKIDSEEKAYWLGFLYADGYIHKGHCNYGIELNLQAQDRSHLEKFKQFIGKDNVIAYKDTTNSYRFQFKDKKIHADLIKLGCTPAKSLTLTFPTSKQVPNKFLKPFIRGYFDGDGSLYTTSRTTGFNILGTYHFLLGLQHRFPQLSSLTIIPANSKAPNRCQRIQSTSQLLVREFLEAIYNNSNIYLNRKYQKYSTIFATL